MDTINKVKLFLIHYHLVRRCDGNSI